MPNLKHKFIIFYQVSRIPSFQQERIGATRSVMASEASVTVIVIGNGIGNMKSKPVLGCLRLR